MGHRDWTEGSARICTIMRVKEGRRGKAKEDVRKQAVHHSRIPVAQEGAGSRFLSLGKVYLIKVGTEILGTQHLSNRK